MQSSMTALCLYGFLISECHRDQGGQLMEGTVASVAPQMARSKVLGRMGLQIPNSSSEEGKYGFRKSPSCILPAPWSPQGCFHIRVSHAHNTEHVQPQVCALRTRQAGPSPQALSAMGMGPSEIWRVRSLLPGRDADTQRDSHL